MSYKSGSVGIDDFNKSYFLRNSPHGHQPLKTTTHSRARAWAWLVAIAIALFAFGLAALVVPRLVRTAIPKQEHRALAAADAAVLLGAHDVWPEEVDRAGQFEVKHGDLAGAKVVYATRRDQRGTVDVTSSAGVLPTEALAHEHFGLLVQQDQMILRFSKTALAGQPRNTLLGDERALTVLGAPTAPTGFLFSVRVGRRVLNMHITGPLRAEQIEPLLAAPVAALATYEP